MNKTIRREFLGNWVLFFVLCLSITGTPVPILHYKECMAIIEEGPENPSAFLEAYRAKRREG